MIRRAVAELVGTGLLVTVVVGSGIAASRLSSADPGLQLLENAAATAAGLAVLILLVWPVSGAHLNPVVSLVDWALGRRSGAGLSGGELGWYMAAQFAGAVGGVVLVNLMFALPAISVSGTDLLYPHTSAETGKPTTGRGETTAVAAVVEQGGR